MTHGQNLSEDDYGLPSYQAHWEDMKELFLSITSTTFNFNHTSSIIYLTESNI